MDTIGIDLHKRESQLCILTEAGALIERRIPTSRAHFTEAFSQREASRVLLEASTESEWVARHLEALGHTVVVADPGFAPMYATRSSRVKTDKRDARTLCEALRLGAYRPIHRVSEAQRHVRSELAVRDALVRTRTRYVAIIKAAVRREGLRLVSGEAQHTARKVAELPLAPGVVQEVTPLLELFAPLNAAIAAADARLVALARQQRAVMRLATMPTIGPITALAFVAALDQVERFASAKQVRAYLGLVPSEYSSADRRIRGRITKRGDVRTRWLLVEAGWRVLRASQPELASLKAWGEQVARRRGKRIAAVALARRIAGILYAMWRDDQSFSGVTRSMAA